MSSFIPFLLCLLISLKINCEENETTITTTTLNDYYDYREENGTEDTLNNLSDQLIDNIVKIRQSNDSEVDENILINWSKAMRSLTDNVWSQILPIALRFQYESSNISVECMSALIKIVYGVKDQQTWAAKFVDAMGKFPSGFLEGTVTNLGDFDQCIDIDIPFEEEMSFRPKYCLFYMTPELPPKPAIIKHSDQVFNLSGTEAEGTFFEYISNSSSGVYSIKHFRIGICIPSNCRNEEIQQIGYQLIKGYKMNASVSQKCVEKNESFSLTIHQTVSLTFISLMVILLIIGTFCDNLTNNSYSEWFSIKFFICWSVGRNLKKLLSNETHCKDLSAIHGIRVLTMMWITVNHSYLFGGLFKIRWIYKRLYPVTKVAESFMFQLIFNTWVLVDSFFFIRILPSLCGVIALQFLWPILNPGPLLIDDETDNYLFKNCENNWWKNLLLINNWSGLYDMCLINTWHLSADFQMFLCAIIILLTFYWKTTYGLILNGAVLLLSIISSAIVAHSHNLYPTIFNDHLINLDYIEKHFKYSYFATYLHLGPYSIGIFIGYLILTKPENFVISKKIRLICWTALPAFSLGVMFMSYPWNQGIEPNRVTSVLYSCLHRNIWCIGLAWITYECALGRGGIVNKLLSSPIFVPFSRLSFGVYLVHLIVIYMRYFSLRSTIYWKHTDFLCNALVFFILSNILAVVLYLLLETPFVNLEKLMFKKKDNKNKTINLEIEKVGKNNLSFNSCSSSDSQNKENIYSVIKL